MASAAMLVGPAGLTMLLMDPCVYQESLAWSVAGTVVARQDARIYMFGIL